MSDDKEILVDDRERTKAQRIRIRISMRMCALFVTGLRSKAGKMVHLPQNICVCSDCMQKAFDTMNNGAFPYGDMMMNIRPEDLKNLTSKYAEISV